jgi:hypothetical protein
VTPGGHRLRLKIDWCSSQEQLIEAQRGEVCTFVCRPAGSFLVWLFRALFRPGHYIDLAPSTTPWDPPAGTSRHPRD